MESNCCRSCRWTGKEFWCCWTEVSDEPRTSRTCTDDCLLPCTTQYAQPSIHHNKFPHVIKKINEHHNFLYCFKKFLFLCLQLCKCRLCHCGQGAYFTWDDSSGDCNLFSLVCVQDTNKVHQQSLIHMYKVLHDTFYFTRLSLVCKTSIFLSSILNPGMTTFPSSGPHIKNHQCLVD